MGRPVVIGEDNLLSLVRIGLTDLQNIGGASGPPGPPGSGTIALERGSGERRWQVTRTGFLHLI